MPRIKGKSLGDFLAQVIGVLFEQRVRFGVSIGIRNECCRLSVGVSNKWFWDIGL